MVVFAATACMSFVAVSVAALQPHTLQNITELTIFLQDLSFAAQIGGAAEVEGAALAALLRVPLQRRGLPQGPHLRLSARGCWLRGRARAGVRIAGVGIAGVGIPTSQDTVDSSPFRYR